MCSNHHKLSGSFVLCSQLSIDTFGRVGFCVHVLAAGVPSFKSDNFSIELFYYRMPLDEGPHFICTSIAFLSPFSSWLVYLLFYYTWFLVYILCNPMNFMVFLKQFSERD